MTDSSHVIYDLVYNWPMYTDYLEKFNKEVMIFSSSKHDGLAGSRFGWGLIKNNDLANDTKQVIRSFVLSLSVDAQLRVLTSQDSIMSEFINSRYRDGKRTETKIGWKVSVLPIPAFHCILIGKYGSTSYIGMTPPKNGSQ